MLFQLLSAWHMFWQLLFSSTSLRNTASCIDFCKWLIFLVLGRWTQCTVHVYWVHRRARFTIFFNKDAKFFFSFSFFWQMYYLRLVWSEIIRITTASNHWMINVTSVIKMQQQLTVRTVQYIIINIPGRLPPDFECHVLVVAKKSLSKQNGKRRTCLSVHFMSLFVKDGTISSQHLLDHYSLNDRSSSAFLIIYNLNN